MLEAVAVHLFNKFRGDSLHFQAYEFADTSVKAGGFDLADLVGGDTLYFEGDEIVHRKLGHPTDS